MAHPTSEALAPETPTDNPDCTATADTVEKQVVSASQTVEGETKHEDVSALDESAVVATLRAAVTSLEVAHPDIATMCKIVDDYRALKNALKYQQQTDQKVTVVKQILGLDDENDSTSRGSRNILADLKTLFSGLSPFESEKKSNPFGNPFGPNW